VEAFALDEREQNLTGNPMAALLYTASSSICTPNSLSREVGLGLVPRLGRPACVPGSRRPATPGSGAPRRHRST
jgi:hypothetical protein